MDMEFRDLIILIILIAAIAFIMMGAFVSNTEGIIQLGSGIILGILGGYGIAVKM